MSLIDAAAFLSEHYPVFPCLPNKRPATEHGFKDAVTDPDAARRLFRAPGAAMIGVPTGEASGLAVIDLDVKEGRFGLEWLAANEHRLPRTRRHRTQSGGLHLLFTYPTGRRIRNSASKIGAGVDVRGEGGYIIAPPSPGYSIEDDAMPCAMPGWLVELLDPPAPERTAVAPQPYRAPMAGDGTPYGLGGLERECRAIRQAPDGAKHDTLNRAAYSIGGLVAAGEVIEGAAYAALSAALADIRHRCEDYPAAERTLKQAFRDGMAAPRQPPPPREVRHTIRIEVAEPDPIPWDAPPAGPDYDDQPAVVEHYTPEPPPPSAGLIWFDDIEPILDTADFVQGLLVEGSAAVVYGDSNTGKTFFTTDLALHVAAGMPWQGRRVEQGGVVYCVLEGGFGFRNRVSAWRTHHAMDGAGLPFAARTSSLNLLDPEADTPRLIAQIQEAGDVIGRPIKLIVIDTLARAFAGGNENASEDMGALVLNMDLIRAETGACVLFVHHSGKDAAKGARGHSSLRAALDTEIEVKANEETGLRTAETVKQREMKKGGAVHFTLATKVIGRNRHGEDVTTCIVEVASSEMVAEAEAADLYKLTDDQTMALRVLTDVIAEAGVGDYPGVPAGCPSVPEAWWRDRFYKRAKPGATDEAKRKAFGRAADKLLKINAVGMDKGRVWLV
jgi:hypothetical protein